MVLTSSPSATFVAIAEQNRADFGFFEVERETENAVRKLDHLVQHHSLRPSMRATPSPVSRTTPTLLLVVEVFSPAIFVSISSSMLLMIFVRLKLLLQALEAIADAAVPDVAAHADAHSAEKRRIDDKLSRQILRRICA